MASVGPDHMRKPGFQAAALGMLLCWQLPLFAQQSGGVDSGFVEQYCVGCHNSDDYSGGLALDLVDHAEPATDAAVWEFVLLKLQTGMMPPPGEERPAPETSRQFIASLETALDRAAGEGGQPGNPGLRRLTRSEYANSIRDLLALEVDVGKLLPADNKSDGFDTNGDTLGSSPALIDAYASAAAKLSRRALGDREAPTVQVDYRPPTGWTQDEHVEGLPFGTRGGFIVDHEFPLDGEYQFNVTTASGTLFGTALPAGTELYLTLDGTPVNLPDLREFRLPVSAGPHRIGITMVDRQRHLGTDDIYTIEKRLGAVAGLSITGPFAPSGPGDTPSRREILICQPETAAEESACARDILTRLAERAYRRPLQPEDDSVEALMVVFEEASAEQDFEYGIEQALARILINPRFLFRLEQRPGDLAPGAVYPVTDLELATRLAYFLWSSLPDAELLDVAQAGELREEGELDRQLQRMLADPRAQALVDNFAAQWLHLGALDGIPVEEFGFDENLKQAMRRETELLIGSVFLEDRSVIDLLDADYTFVDEQLAAHYGIEGVSDSYMRRVSLQGLNERRGLLGQGSILALTSMVDRTSPVVRGKWIMENLLGAPVPAPPPGVETNLEPDTSVDATPRSLRERLELHREQPQCAACHRVMDPIGFALENFDRTGKWRELDSGVAIDARGELTDGTALDGPDSLRRWMVEHPRIFVQNLTRKLLVYALGRSVDHHDMPLVRSIVADAAAQDYRFSALLSGIIHSPAFQYRQLPGANDVLATAATSEP